MFDQWSTIGLTLRQVEEALSDNNAYYFFLKHGRPHNGPMELIRYFLENRTHAIHDFVVVDDEQLALFV